MRDGILKTAGDSEKKINMFFSHVNIANFKKLFYL